MIFGIQMLLSVFFLYGNVVAEPIAIPRGLPLRPKLTREEFQAQQEAKLREGAKMYEQYFLHDMVKAMRKTVTPGFAQPSYGEKIYREQLDSRYVEAWAKKGGVGIADVIYNQLHERYFPKRSPDRYPDRFRSL